MKKELNGTTILEDFQRRCDISETGCWLWTGMIYNGYGKMSETHRGYKLTGERRAHRASYHARFGSIPTGMVVRHKCNQSRCCNPDHLTLGTQLDNRLDALKPLEKRDTSTLLNDRDNVLRLLEDQQPENQRRIVLSELEELIFTIDSRYEKAKSDELRDLKHRVSNIDEIISSKIEKRTDNLLRRLSEIEEEIGKRK